MSALGQKQTLPHVCLVSALTWKDAMAIEKVIKTQDAEENTISVRYSLKEGAVIVSAPDGSRLKAWAGANAEATAKMLLREWARKN
jgi:hypothetical protein